MHLFFKSYRIYLIFFLLFTCESCFKWGFAQDHGLQLSPWIQEINLPSQYSEIPNETLFRDLEGTLFIGKENGLNIISGPSISHFPMNGPVYVCGGDSDTLYYVSENDLGFILREEGGSYRTISRKHLLPASRRSFTPSGIQNESGLVLIYTNNGTFRLTKSEMKLLDKKDERVEAIPPNELPDKEFLEMIGDKIGIPADGIRQVFIWNKSEIWILGAYTLHQIYEPSPLNILETGAISTGRILKSKVIKDRILLGTSHGIFSVSKDLEKRNQWTMVNLLPESIQSVHMFSTINGQVFAAGSKGLYLITNSHAELIDKGSFTGIKALRKGIILAASQEGILKYKLNYDGWESTTINPSLKYAHSFTAYNNSTFFLCNEGVFSINKRADKITSVPFHSDELLFKLLKVEQDLLLVSSQQVYRYEKNEEVFQPLTEGHRSKLLSKSDMILPATRGNFWILQNSGDYLSRVLYTSNLDEPTATYTAFPVLPYLGEVVDMAFADSVLYVTGKDKIALFDLHLLKGGPEKVSISRLDSEPSDKGLEFHFSGLELQRLPEPLFRYRIRPGNSHWSGWSSIRDYKVSELRHGKYFIEMQAMDLYGRVTETAQMPFTIAPPFYASWYAYLTYGILLLVGLYLMQKWRIISFNRAESRVEERMEVRFQNLTAEKERSDKLVAEILPEETANQIKTKGKAKWDKYERATVLFSDIQGFTRIAEEMNPENLIDELDTFFFHFDSVVEKYNIEKIKTIGDAYMAAGGIPHKNSTNPVEVVMAALEMQSYMQDLKSSRAEIWDLRIGIHTGPVIAGVVGHKKISYDIWGDTVNTASRMESSGTAGKINISGITYGMVKDYFLCEYRGKLPVKYKGKIDMYYVNGLRPELSVDLKEIPNRRFFLKLQLLRLGDLEDIVFNDILTKLPESIHFHSLEYARKVYNHSFLLCRSEGIEQEGRLLARTAALMLFTGLTQDYHNFENRSAVISREILPEFSYSEKQVDQICNLILATKIPFKPNNRLEKILIDARMDYIGWPSYTKVIKDLFKELTAAGSNINGQQFKKQQQELLFNFEFYTVAAQRMREVSGSDQMSTLDLERWI
jgi:adenylate cyclase